MRPLLARIKPPRSLRTFQYPTINTSSTPIAIRRPITTTTPTSAEETLNDRLRRRLWGGNVPEVTAPQISPAEGVDENVASGQGKVKLAKHVTEMDMEGYVPKHDGRGLRVVGIVGKLGMRVEEVPLESFPAKHKVMDFAELEALLRRAVVETYANVLFGRKPDEGIVRRGEGQGVGVDWTKGVEVVRNEDGGFRFLFRSEEMVQGILNQGQGKTAEKGVVSGAAVENAKPTEDTVVAAEVTDSTVAAAEPTEDATSEKQIAEEIEIEKVATTSSPAFPPLPLTDAWLSLPLPPLHLFAIHKRLLLTTGHLLPDNALTHSPTASSLLKALREVAAPPPEKLDLLSIVPELAELKNVKVLKTRLRPVDREIEKGRLSPAQKEWLENKKRRERGEEVEGNWTYKWDEGRYFAA